MNDNRLHLKIKIKNLADEARTIRAEERKLHGIDKWTLQHHRKTTVRAAARRTLIAYQIIRGKDPTPNMSREFLTMIFDRKEIERMVRKYGSTESTNILAEILKAA
jgi:hypothetical protein